MFRLSLTMTYCRICNNRGTTGEASEEAGTVYPSAVHFLVLIEVRVVHSLVLCAVFCQQLFVFLSFQLSCLSFYVRLLMASMVSLITKDVCIISITM